jgi:glycosyltransferase involved in cell wall biosynthesis
MENLISVTVPFFNEENNVRPLYSQLKEVLEKENLNYEIIFVDDGSTDGTLKALKEIHHENRKVRVIKLRKNFGQTAALSAGFDHAQGEIIVSMDGDLQHNPRDLPKLLKKIEEGYDMVSGWREERKDPFFTRKLPSRVANWLIHLISGVDIHDFGTTFKAYRREIIKNIRLYGELHRFIPALASQLGASITEVPIENIPRRHGKSSYNLSRTIRVVFDLITVKFLISYSTKPLQIFGIWGSVFSLAGFIIGLYLTIKKFLYHTALMVEHGPLLMLAILLIVTGFQFVTMGLLGEMITRVYYETRNKPTYSVEKIFE